MKKIVSRCCLLIVLTTGLSACKKEQNAGAGTYTDSGSALVLNEGAFMKNNGSVSYVSRDNRVTNGIFEQANNGRVPGDVLQSYTRAGNFGIICANNSQKVVFVDARTFRQVAEITDGTDYPRHALGVSADKVYISNGSGAGTVLVVNLNTFSVVKTIPVGDGPEQLLQIGNKVYVANSGGFGNDHTISVLNTDTDAEERRIDVGDYPGDLVKDAEGKIWVLCKGNVSYPPPTYAPKRITAAKLVRVDPSTNTVIREFDLMPATADLSEAANLCISGNGNNLFLRVDDQVYEIPIQATSLPAAPIIQRLFYGLAVHPYTGEIWGLDAGNFNEAGQVIRYDASAHALDSFSVGIIPNSVYFN